MADHKLSTKIEELEQRLILREARIEELRNELNRLKEIIKLMPGSVYWKDSSGKYLGCNNNVAEILKLPSPNAIVGKTNYDLFDRDLATAASEIDLQVVSNDQTLFLEEIGLNSQGEKAVYLTQKIPLHDKNQKVIGLLGISMDITNRKKAEILEKQKNVAEEKIQSMKMLAGSIAHELRTPLRTIDLAAGGIQKYLPILLEAYNIVKKDNDSLPIINPDHYEILKEALKYIQSEVEHSFFAIDMLLTNLKDPTTTGSNRNIKICSIRECVKKAFDRYPFETNQRNLLSVDIGDNFYFKETN